MCVYEWCGVGLGGCESVLVFFVWVCTGICILVCMYTFAWVNLLYVYTYVHT